MKKKIINILIVFGVVYSCYLIYIYCFQKLIYSRTDFYCSQIKSAKDYEISKYCIETYLQNVHDKPNNIKYFLRNNQVKKHSQYNKVIKKTYVDVQLDNVKKNIGDIYIVYYNINSEDTEVRRIVFRRNILMNTYQIISDSSYESMEV